MNVPSLRFVDLHDDKYRFDKYWGKLSDTDVNIPKTKIIKLDDNSGIDYPECPVNEIYKFMDKNEFGNAFIRSGHKAAIDRFRDGSLITNLDESEIKRTYNSLMTQHIRNNIPHSNTIVVRELLDINYCLEPNHSHTFEIRYFIEDGQILYQTPKEYQYTISCPMKYEYLENNFKDIKQPDSQIMKIAKEFEDSNYSWSVDAVLDCSGKWWITEMHINGVYYNEDMDKWMNVCGHSELEYNSPRWIHSSALPKFDES